MARPCNSKSQKQTVIVVDESSRKKCKFKLEFNPPNTSSEESSELQKIPNQRNVKLSGLAQAKNSAPKKKATFQCHFEERKRRAELRRKKIIQRLKKIYQIDVEGLNEYIAKDIIRKTEIFEKEKREREKRKAERSMIMITRLLEEQKYKLRGRRVCHPLRKISQSAGQVEKRPTEPRSVICFSDFGETAYSSRRKVSKKKPSSLNEVDGLRETLSKQQNLLGSDPNWYQLQLAEGEETPTKEEKTGTLPECQEKNLSENIPKVYDIEKVRCKTKPAIETYLESTPKKVIFKDYERNKVYLQDLKITNICCETIHCRYLGIVVHTKTEERFPIGVAIRDNVKLRPGLCCSTKIRLCSQDDSKKLECSIVYETRRAKTLLQHSWFLVPVVCIPVQAIIKVTPQKICFPTLSWLEATRSKDTTLLCKTLKIENSGAKGCYCRISRTKLECESDTETRIYEGEYERESLRNMSDTMYDYKYQSDLSLPEISSEEYYGESRPNYQDGSETARKILDEIIDSMFGVFRFSQKFCIRIPPFSTVFIQILFVPQYKGFHHETHYLQFEDCENCKELAIELMGDIKRVPLKVEPLVIDLKTCISNSGVYSGTFKIFNESKGPLWVVLKVPSSVKRHAHVYPRATIIMPFGSSGFSVRLYPRVTLARDAFQYYSEDSKIFEFPIFIHPGNTRQCRREYIKIYVMALVTDYCLQLSPPIINFGSVSTLETVRTELELTNHSLAIQEYGFLNLPKGVRVEPNMGFGRILPKETITLYLLYSPQEEFLQCEEEQKVDEFQISVTSIAKNGGFKEKQECWEDSFKPLEIVWEDAQGKSTPKTHSSEYQELEEYEECEENSSVEDEEFCFKLDEKGCKIREFLTQDLEETSENTSPTRATSQEYPSFKTSLNNPGEYGEGFYGPRWNSAVKKDLHIVNCHAVVIKPSCRLSASIIRLPATPCSSFSLYRFRLSCIGENYEDCVCGFRKTPKKPNARIKTQIRFEFHYESPHFKLEPESGILKPGNSIPITVIYRPVIPEMPEEELKKQRTSTEVRDLKETISESSSGVKSKKKLTTPKVKASGTTVDKVTSVVSQEMKNSDNFAGGKASMAVLETVPERGREPFLMETKVQCVVKTAQCRESNEKVEIHEMVLICPVIGPKFTFLGECAEIKFDKVFIGTKSKIIFQIQNVSFERISPSVTFLNPTGSFYCPAGVHDEEVDPEHIWRQPLTYTPLKKRGVERQFFEIFCGSTNVFLTVSGEGVTPDFKINPNFACCQMESKPGVMEEMKLEIENQSAIALNICIQIKLLTRIPALEKVGNEGEEEVKGPKKEKTSQKEDTKDKKKPKKSGNQNCKFWDEIPEAISSSLHNPDNVKVDESLKIFTFADSRENNEFRVPPLLKQQIKILFTPPPDKSDGAYAFQFSLMLEKNCPLKEVLVIGKVSKGK